MRILTVCDEGNNRAVHFAHLLRYKYKGSEVIPVGMNVLTPETLKMLYDWADYIILTHGQLLKRVPEEYNKKVKLFDVGSDHYPRPFNPFLYVKAKQLIEKNILQ